MDALIVQLTTALRGMWKHRWLGMLVAWPVAVVGLVVVMAMPDRYEASARISVDSQSILKPLMSGLAVQPNFEQQVVMLSRTLISRPNIERLVRMADLDLGVQTKSAQESLIDGLLKTLEIKNAGRDNLYTLSYRDTDPEKAKRVVQSLVSIFIESSTGGTRKDTDKAKTFIDEQIKNYVSKLEAAEARLKAFKVRHIDLQTADGKDISSRLAEISTQLSEARLELAEAENSRNEAKRQLESERTQNANFTSNSLLQESALSISTPEIDARIAAQKNSLDNLLQRFTEEHPDVVGARRLIKDLEMEKRKQVQELRKIAIANPSSPMNNGLVSQEMNRVLAATDVRVAGLRTRVAEYEARYNRARGLIRMAPQIESEFAQLNRDYAINKKNYEDLVARRESAALSGSLEQASGVADFRLIDPPRTTPTPVAPNRQLLFILVLLGSLGAGGATAFAVSQVRPVFYSTHVLRAITGLPLLGVVTIVPSESAKMTEKLDLKRFLAASGSLVGLFTVGMLMLSFLSRRVG
jgi:polysaccharide chain length determinant protein (PEP-CTERM system associated)